jgi:hypothetical protein
MYPTPYPDVNAILEALLVGVQDTLPQVPNLREGWEG